METVSQGELSFLSDEHKGLMIIIGYRGPKIKPLDSGPHHNIKIQILN